MSKPILSELEYNADDVASAILSNADLSVTNQDFAVTDRASEFSMDSYFTANPYKNMYSFNGFMFFNFYIYKEGATPSHNQKVYEISSGFRPNATYAIPSNGHQGDTVEMLEFKTNGDVLVANPHDEGSTTYFILASGWYRFD